MASGDQEGLVPHPRVVATLATTLDLRNDSVRFKRTFSRSIVMTKKQSTPSTSSLAAKILAGQKATQTDAKKLAGSVLSQDEKKGNKR